MKNLTKINPKRNVYQFSINKVKILPIFCFAAFIVFTACSKDDLNPLGACGNSNWVLEVNNELEAWSSALQTYSNDPTIANCNAYKNAGNDYLDALEKIKKCVPSGSNSDFNEAIAEAKASIEETDCQ